MAQCNIERCGGAESGGVVIGTAKIVITSENATGADKVSYMSPTMGWRTNVSLYHGENEIVVVENTWMGIHNSADTDATNVVNIVNTGSYYYDLSTYLKYYRWTLSGGNLNYRLTLPSSST